MQSVTRELEASYGVRVTMTKQVEMAEFPSSSEGETEVGAAQHPWPYLKEMFEFIEREKNSYYFNCRLCVKKTRLSSYCNSSSNLRKHIVVSSSLHDYY